MKITTNPLCNEIIGAPSDMQDDCSALPVFKHTDEHGQWSASFWKPEAAELAALNAGGDVILNVRAAGRQHPVVSVGVVAPPAPVPASETIGEWQRCEQISNLSDVYEALQGFADDHTGDNATCVVRAVLRAAN